VAVVEVAGVEAEAVVAADVGTTDEVAATAVAAGASSLQKVRKEAAAQAAAFGCADCFVDH
jgi:hypothetical protein